MDDRLFSIGHSNHTLEKFLQLLKMHEIEAVADVRSRPFTKYATHFNGPVLQHDLVRAGLKYIFLGKEMGGMPDAEELQTVDGQADHEKIATSQLFKDGMHRLRTGLNNYRIVLLCGEENPTGCHRRNLIGNECARVGINVQHIRASGQLESQADLARLEPEKVAQLRLF